ncbi:MULTISPECIES: alpha/beta fold hydrolase [unclassified Streptomyces]|uniref:alpha/beta fold hydrolase n=1 Tax=unclassified Streptomyces TaxID=2593676 RepID=UPI00372096C3
MATFVLVPGAWLGAWVWEDTAEALRGHGHTALPLTLTGLAERADRGGPDTDLETHIADITGFVERNDLRDVTLVAHSYAAAPVTGAAARLGDRVERVVYVDSAPFATGMRMLDLMPPEEADRLRREVAESGDGWRLPMPPFEVLGRYGSVEGIDADREDVLRARATDQPFGTYTQPLAGPAEPGADVDRVLIACRDFTGMLEAGVPMLAFLGRPPWRRFDLPTGHWPMLSAPADLAGLLDEAAA